MIYKIIFLLVISLPAFTADVKKVDPSDEELQEFEAPSATDSNDSEDEDVESPIAIKVGKKSRVVNLEEPWYLHFSLGFGNLSYGTPVSNGVAKLQSMSTVKRVNLIGDIAGVYYPSLDSKNLTGGSIHTGYDYFSDGVGTVYFLQNLVALSHIRFFGSTPGAVGWFVRGDVGYARFETSTTSKDLLTTAYPTENGFGFLVATGYSLAIGNGGTRFAPSITYSYLLFSAYSVTSATFSLGIIF